MIGPCYRRMDSALWQKYKFWVELYIKTHDNFTSHKKIISFIVWRNVVATWSSPVSITECWYIWSSFAFEVTKICSWWTRMTSSLNIDLCLFRKHTGYGVYIFVRVPYLYCVYFMSTISLSVQNNTVVFHCVVPGGVRPAADAVLITVIFVTVKYHQINVLWLTYRRLDDVIQMAPEISTSHVRFPVWFPS